MALLFGEIQRYWVFYCFGIAKKQIQATVYKWPLWLYSVRLQLAFMAFYGTPSEIYYGI